MPGVKSSPIPPSTRSSPFPAPPGEPCTPKPSIQHSTRHSSAGEAGGTGCSAVQPSWSLAANFPPPAPSSAAPGSPPAGPARRASQRGPQPPQGCRSLGLPGHEHAGTGGFPAGAGHQIEGSLAAPLQLGAGFALMKSAATHAHAPHTHTPHAHTQAGAHNTRARTPGSLARSIQCILLASTGAAAKREGSGRGEGLKGTKAPAEPPLQQALASCRGVSSARASGCWWRRRFGGLCFPPSLLAGRVGEGLTPAQPALSSSPGTCTAPRAALVPRESPPLD